MTAEVNFAAGGKPSEVIACALLYGKGGFGQVVFACDFLHQCIGGVFVQYTDCGRVALEHLLCKCVNVITFHNTRPP